MNTETISTQHAVDETGQKLARDSSITHLLQQVGTIAKKYEDIAAATGENYNIFQILRLSTNEVRTHSAFLGNLLDPQGSHGMKDKFLKAFIRKFNVDGYNLSEDIAATVKVEEYHGSINNEQNTGGRIDIVVKPRNGAWKVIVIENKIYALDQEMQLVRYKNAYKDCHLLYLTLNGEEPGEQSACGLKADVDFYCIAYRNHIIEWLEECHKEASSHPLLRETLVQYINLIKFLTHQTINENMKEEIVELLARPENIGAAREIADNYTNALARIVHDLGERVQEKILMEMLWDPDNEELYFWKTNWKCAICFAFHNKYSEVEYGLTERKSEQEGWKWLHGIFPEINKQTRLIGWDDSSPWPEVSGEKGVELFKNAIEELSPIAEKFSLNTPKK